MQVHDIDWRMVLRSWDISALLYLRGIIDEILGEKQSGCTRRKTMIGGQP